MAEGTSVVAFYTSRPPEDVVDDALAACKRANFEVDSSGERDHGYGDNEYRKLRIERDGWSYTLSFNLEAGRPPSEPILSIGCGQKTDPSDAADETEYREKMDGVFELLCRLSAALDVDYAPLFNPMDRAAVPEQRPIAAAIDELPRIGVYSEAVVDQLGGVDAMFETPPWYTAAVDDGHTVMIESDSPWVDGGWRPPTDAAFAIDPHFHDEEDNDETTAPSKPGLTDPFVSLDSGEYGTDVCVHREDVASEFRNEDLELVRVYLDDGENLRRITDDSFVRNVTTADVGDETAFVRQMLADVPPDASEGDLMVSALLHETIPPSFVHLDDPDGENIVTRVMDLDVETDKIELLISLGRATQHGSEQSIATIESALATLAELEDVEEVEDWIDSNLV